MFSITSRSTLSAFVLFSSHMFVHISRLSLIISMPVLRWIQWISAREPDGQPYGNKWQPLPTVFIPEKKTCGSHQTSSDLYFSKNEPCSKPFHEILIGMAYEIIPIKLRSILHYIKLVYYDMDDLSRDHYRFQAQLNTTGCNPWIHFFKPKSRGPNWSLLKSVCLFLFLGSFLGQPQENPTSPA